MSRVGRTCTSTRGFTLVELLVATVAGFLVALGVLALARDATVQFQDQLRVSQTEMTLRVASQRLTADLGRAAYMSTSHLALDPRAGRLDDSKIYNPDAVAGLPFLAGAWISKSTAPDATNPLLDQDQIVLAGNFTTTDEYQASVDDTASAGGCSGPLLRLNDRTTDAAVMRLVQGAADDAGRDTLVKNAFMPGGAQTPVRVVNALGDGREWYVVACAAGFGLTPVGAYVQLTRALPSNFKTPIINPVHFVRWQVQDVTTLPAALKAALGGGDGGAGGDAPHYVLTRAFASIATAALASIPDTLEVVADHAVDLSFGVTVLPLVGTAMTTYAFDKADVGLWAGKIGAVPAATPAADNGLPNRIRAIQYRISVRAAIADRDRTLPSPQGFPVRYAVNETDKRYARLRTFIGEVALSNQMSDSYATP